MAIKFSQFVVKTSSSDLSHIVGYNGVDNIQITPTNFLNSALTGTPGQVLFYDTTGVAGDNDLYWDNTNKKLGVGTSNPNRLLHIKDTSGIASIAITSANTGTAQLELGGTSDNDIAGITYNGSTQKLFLKTNNTGQLYVDNSGNVGIGTANPGEKLEVVGNIKVGDSQKFIAGESDDLQIFYDGTDSRIYNDAGDFVIRNQQDDGDIKFQSDDGSGGVATYFQLDGSDVITLFSKATRHIDSVKANFGNSNDLQILHDSTNSSINNLTGNLNIKNTATDGDISFFGDNGSGGTTEYFRVDGSSENVLFSKIIKLSDNVELRIGDGNDLKLFSDGSNGYVSGEQGDLYIRNRADDRDIFFQCDDGSGGATTYFFLDGSIAGGGFVYTRFPDNSTIAIGTGSDLQIRHDGNNSIIENSTGNLRFTNTADDKDIIFQCDDGSGGTTEYFRLDGASIDIRFSRKTRHLDNVKAEFGNSGDFDIYYDGSNALLVNGGSAAGDIQVINNTDDGSIKFFSDDGTGSTTEYFRVDGGVERNIFSKDSEHGDNISAYFGSGNNMRILYNGSHGFISQNVGGDLRIVQNVDDGDIKFEADDGSGGVTTYFKLDGGNERLQVNAPNGMLFSDNIKAKFGDGGDLQIYHDGTNSYIQDNGTGDLLVYFDNEFKVIKNGSSEVCIEATADGSVDLYHDNSKKFETTSNGVRITGVSEYADNAAAIAAGLSTGDVYRTGDLLKIVH